MKVPSDKLATMVAAFRAVPAERIEAHRKHIEAEGRARDVGMRLRWDLLYATLGSRWVCDELYARDRTLNDTHIDTALRHVMREIGL